MALFLFSSSISNCPSEGTCLDLTLLFIVPVWGSQVILVRLFFLFNLLFHKGQRKRQRGEEVVGHELEDEMKPAEVSASWRGLESGGVRQRRRVPAGSHQAAPGGDGGTGSSGPFWWKKGGAGGELGFSGSGATVLRWVGDALCGGYTWEPPGRAYQSQGLSCILTPARSEVGGGRRGRGTRP